MDAKNLPTLLRSNEIEKKTKGFCRTVKDVNSYIGADYQNQTPIDFDCYNSHPYQRTTRIIKNFLTQPFYLTT